MTSPNATRGGKAHSAFDPSTSVFVSANAGSGKTSLLTNRVLSLLLHGVSPEKILCLTFTNAAAAEMNSRIVGALGSWVMASDDELVRQVSKLTGDNPSATLLTHARSLFAAVLESPQGVNIETIHGFSQSLLRRFPLEAGISPHFTVMDGRSEQETLFEARLRLFSNAQNSDKKLKKSIDNIARNIGEHSFGALMGEIVGSKRKFLSMLQNVGSSADIEYKLYKKFSIAPNDTKESLFAEHFVYSDEQQVRLRKIADILLHSQEEKPVDVQTGARLADWLARPEERAQLLDGYIANFVTLEGTPRKRIFTKNALPYPELVELLQEEQNRVFQFADKLRAIAIINHTIDVLHIAEALLAEYEAIKRSHAWMDYDDLILSACKLLTIKDMSAWVLFKLDGGIDHILVDEAQDTSPEQWQIIDALTQEFFAGQGARESTRSLFVVGDEKQSIYSFQGANVKELARMRGYFSEMIQASEKKLHTLSLAKSYRSTEAVLQTVDAVFTRVETRAGVTFSDEAFSHILTRIGHSGVVELYPVIKPEENETITPATKLARHIAGNIKDWINKGEAQAGDIMILLRRRTTLADKLVRALKRRGVPVAGSDRMLLNDSLAVQDLISLGQVLLLPDDDLTLAALLKSPIFNLSEDDLFTIAHNRGAKTIWQRLGEMEEFASAYELLTDLRARADFTPPFELYSYLLNNKQARARFIGRMGEETADPIDEFLQQTIIYEKTHPPSLQGFIHWLSESSSEIKRDMEQAQGMVRIMTVHGAKGLQSKIVILPDTMRTPTSKDSLFWADEFPIRGFNYKQDDSVLSKIRYERKSDELSEYRRLLYVALTRAEDRLYIYGATGDDKISEESWYHHIKEGMLPIATAFTTEFGDGLRVGESLHPAGGEATAQDPVLLLRSPQDYNFLTTPPQPEPSPSKPLTPSKFEDASPAIASPLTGKDVYATGKFVHLLLQYLPAQKAEKRESAAKIIALKFASEISEQLITKAINDVLAVINNEKFAFLFGKDSLAEVPVTGNVEIDGKTVTISGQIDRLYMGIDAVWIVDFKSNQLPPDSPQNIPKAYIRQLALYKLLLQKITPEKSITCALLWTANAKLEVISEDVLQMTLDG